MRPKTNASTRYLSWSKYERKDDKESISQRHGPSISPTFTRYYTNDKHSAIWILFQGKQRLEYITYSPQTYMDKVSIFGLIDFWL